MPLQFLNNIFNVQDIHILFKILAHSLWIGAIMALLAGITIMFTKTSGPQVRYKLLISLLFLFIASMIYVTLHAMAIESSYNSSGESVVYVLNNLTIDQQSHITQSNIFTRILVFIEGNATVLVSLWFVVISFKCIQLILGLRSMHYLKKRNTTCTDEDWNKKIVTLAQKLGISKTITLLESSFTKIPMVIGHLKPVILFPVGMLNALPQNEVEAILLHELAHIRRNDFLINIVQQFVEIIFFFNPAVIWISALIKNERENCCDDLAIAVTKDKKNFIHALVAFQEYHSEEYATTLSGKKNNLLNRVKRIITNNNKTLNNMEKLLLASGIIVTCLVTVAFTPKQEKDQKHSSTSEATAQTTGTVNQTKEESNNNIATYETANDTLPKKQTTETTSKTLNFDGTIDGKKIQLKEENGTIKELYVDGIKVPESEYNQYKPLIDKLHQQLKENEVKMKMQQDELQKQKIVLEKQSELMQQQADKMKEHSKQMELDVEKQKQLMEQKMNALEKDGKISGSKDSLMQLELAKMKKDLMSRQEEFKQQQIEFEKKMQDFKLQQEKLKQMIIDSAGKPGAEKISINAAPVIKVQPTQVNQKPVRLNIKPAATLETKPAIQTKPAVQVTKTIDVKPAIKIAETPTSEKIILKLEKENVITNRNNLSFHLTNDELIVNDIKQSNDVHQKILNEVSIKPGDKISFSYSNQQR